MSMKRMSIVVSGRVQGVGYRYFAQEAAEVLGVTGWARNHFDRTVEIEAQADEHALEFFCGRLREGPALAYVANLDRHDLPLVDDESSFEVRS